MELMYVWWWNIEYHQNIVLLGKLLPRNLLFVLIYMLVGFLIDAPCIHAVPATPTLNVCAVYDSLNRALQFIESTWMEVVCCVWSYTYTDCTEKFSDVKKMFTDVNVKDCINKLVIIINL